MMPQDYYTDERRRMIEQMQPLNRWGVLGALLTSVGFWVIVAIVVGLVCSR